MMDSRRSFANPIHFRLAYLTHGSDSPLHGPYLVTKDLDKFRARHCTMNDHLKGCGKDEGARTLYAVKDDAPPIPLGVNYWHVRCGYRPPSKIQNGILLCDACIAKLGLPASRDSTPHL